MFGGTCLERHVSASRSRGTAPGKRTAATAVVARGRLCAAMSDSVPPTIIDAWMQHPTPRFMAQPWLDSLKRWTGNDFAGPWPLAATLASMDAGNVAVGLISAWVGPMGALVSNDEVAGWVAQAPDRLVGI